MLFEYDRLDNSIKGDDKEQLLALRKQLSAFDHLKPEPLPVADGAGDVSDVAPPTTIPGKGTRISPAFLTVMAPPEPEFQPNGLTSTGRRAALAEWITDPRNPLTTRVIVNRVWQYHFGRGLAPNSSDFGTLGGLPSHPELLDWLTAQFIDGGLTFKSLHRLIVTSAVWRQSASHARMDQYKDIDPENLYLWRRQTRRLDAEQIRDAILLTTGQLDLESGGPGVQSDTPRRSIYLRVMRNERDSLLDAFDLPLFFTSTASRDSTTSPIQSLVMFNSQIMLQHAAALAASVDRQTPLNEQLATVWQKVFARSPDSHELAEATRFVQEHARLIHDERGDATLTSLPVGRLPYRNGQSILLDPESETLPRLRAPSTTGTGLSSFTVEAYFQVRSVYESGAVRTITSRWNGSSKTSGWTFGITGKGSRRKPQTLVLQMFGRDKQHQLVEAAVFSDQHVELNTPYYAAAVVQLGSGGDGNVTFYLKDLSNDDEPMNRVVMPHQIRSLPDNQLPVTVGARSTGTGGVFDGLIDDIRLSSLALQEGQLLYANEEPLDTTMTWWRFEPEPGVFQDSSGNAHHIMADHRGQTMLTPDAMALVDFCHALLNSNEFLYLD